MYPYDLGWHRPTNTLVRIPKGTIPQDCVKVIRYREMTPVGPSLWWREAYDEYGSLRSNYWSIHRVRDAKESLAHTLVIQAQWQQWELLRKYFR